MKTFAEYKKDPSVAGLTGKAKSAAVERLMQADAVAEAIADAATSEAACETMVSHYDAARAAVEALNLGLFGKALDRAARKQAIKMAGVKIPAGMTRAWATPSGWGQGPMSYRARTAKEMQW